MSFLSQITQGFSPNGLRIIIAGQEKIGKTTMATGAPSALLLPLEVGFAGVDVPKTPMLQSYEQTIQALNEIQAAAQDPRFPFKSLILDSATALERHIHDYVLRQDPTYAKGNRKALTMESALGGYGKAYQYANELFVGILQQLDQLAVYRNINIILTCHVFAAKIMDPASGEYDSWDLLLHSPKNQKTYGKREIVSQWADIIGFLHEPMFVSKTDNMSKGVSQNKGRVLGINRTPSYVAGNRFGIQSEISIPPNNGWNHFADALYKASGIDLFKR